jgi:hypothetical protein
MIHFGHGTCPKVRLPPGPAQHGVLPRAQIDCRAMRNLLFLGHLLDRQSDREDDANGDLCLSCTVIAYPEESD